MKNVRLIGVLSKYQDGYDGLLRQYFPEGIDFRTLSQSDTDIAVNRLNHRPHKTPEFKAAAKMMEKSLLRITA